MRISPKPVIPSHIYTEHKQVHHTQLSDPSFLRSRWQKECSACMSVSACHLLPKQFQYIYYLRTCKRSISPKKLQLLCDFSSPNQTDCPGDCSAPARSACPEERNREECKACTASTRVKLKHSVTRWCRQDGDGLPCVHDDRINALQPLQLRLHRPRCSGAKHVADEPVHHSEAQIVCSRNIMTISVQRKNSCNNLVTAHTVASQ